jgi:hypothetical protein
MKNWMLAILVVWGFGVPLPARAECLAGRVTDMKRGAVLVFEGTVTKVDRLETGEYASTMSVHRVWKGHASEVITVYYVPSLDGPVLEEGMSRIVFAVRKTPMCPRMPGMLVDGPPRDAWVPPCCGTAGAMETVRRQLGRSHKPSQASRRGGD